MSDEIIDLLQMVVAGKAIDKAAHKRRWARAIQMRIGLLWLVLLGGAMYLTLRYS